MKMKWENFYGANKEEIALYVLYKCFLFVILCLNDFTYLNCENSVFANWGKLNKYHVLIFVHGNI